jgi:hypothetical protein
MFILDSGNVQKRYFFFEIDVCGSLLPEVSEDYYYKTGM